MADQDKVSKQMNQLMDKVIKQINQFKLLTVGMCMSVIFTGARD
jgi:hypothetical protein